MKRMVQPVIKRFRVQGIAPNLKKLGNQGFTLLELLVALALSAVVTVILAQALSLAIRAREVGDRRTQADQRARIIMNKLSTEISSAYFYRYKKKTPAGKNLPQNSSPKKDEILAFKGDTDSLSFVSSAKLADHDLINGGLKEISIYTSFARSDKRGELYIEEKKLDTLDPLNFNNRSEKENLYSDFLAELQFKYLVAKKKQDPLGNTFFMSENWEESYNQSSETTNNSETLLIGIELSLSILEAPDNQTENELRSVTYPPLFIRVHANQEIIGEEKGI
ncbi:MAG: prepilin-type N-terminal cleavage/methylation domain-containing protein [Nitrospinota bacterium]